MGAPYNVKAREHHGSESLDITIPAELKREYEISPGDVFLVEADESDNQLVLRYERIHNAED
jgi:UDP-N-acetylmuramate-alanine ligase